MHRLSRVYGVPVEELLRVQTTPTPPAPQIAAFIAGDLSTRLLAIALNSHCTYAEVQAKIRFTLEEAMNDITRREAIGRLIAIAMYPIASMHAGEALTQSASIITVCQELGKSKESADLSLALEGAAAALHKLQPIIKDSSRYRKQAAILATQAARLQAVFARHLQGPDAAIRFAQEAVSYGKESGDVPGYLQALITLAWAYYYDSRYALQALHTMEQAVSIVKEQRGAASHTHGEVYSALAVMQARNGIDSTAALRLGGKYSFTGQDALYMDDPVIILSENIARSAVHQRDYNTALSMFSQLIDMESKDNEGTLLLTPKRVMSERERLSILSTAAQATLGSKNKDLEYSTALWKAAMSRARSLKSEQRFNQVVMTYQSMDILWGDDSRVQALRPLTVHW